MTLAVIIRNLWALAFYTFCDDFNFCNTLILNAKMDVFNKFYSSVSNTVSQLSGVLPGNPVTREFEATQYIASAGPGKALCSMYYCIWYSLEENRIISVCFF